MNQQDNSDFDRTEKDSPVHRIPASNDSPLRRAVAAIDENDAISLKRPSSSQQLRAYAAEAVSTVTQLADRARPVFRALTVAWLPPDELWRICDINRYEEIEYFYTLVDGELIVSPASGGVQCAAWSTSHGGSNSVGAMMASWQPLLEKGGHLLGAFESGKLVGFSILAAEASAGTRAIEPIHVTHPLRRQGVGSLLIGNMVREARALGTRHLYASVPPTASAVEFFRKHGFKVASHRMTLTSTRSSSYIPMVRSLTAPGATG